MNAINQGEDVDQETIDQLRISLTVVEKIDNPGDKIDMVLASTKASLFILSIHWVPKISLHQLLPPFCMKASILASCIFHPDIENASNTPLSTFLRCRSQVLIIFVGPALKSPASGSKASKEELSNSVALISLAALQVGTNPDRSIDEIYPAARTRLKKA
ncbi:hypothetical protein H2248_002487 [Termitomyces sp. 'cryptogamus']|nr:hypothetical protein H2248_002487 [Termitomyces sp. 'cryptogamus']